MVLKTMKEVQNLRSLHRTLLTCFESLYMNMYYISPSDGTVSRCMLILEIYEATPLYLTLKNELKDYPFKTVRELLTEVYNQLRRISCNSRDHVFT